MRKLGLEGNSRQKKVVEEYNKSLGKEKVIFIDSLPKRFSGHEPDASIFKRITTVGFMNSLSQMHSI